MDRVYEFELKSFCPFSYQEQAETEFRKQLDIKDSQKGKFEKDLGGLKKDMEVVQHDLKAANIKVSEVESRLTEQNRQLDAALSDRLELEAKVEAASDERRSLLGKKCAFKKFSCAISPNFLPN